MSWPGSQRLGALSTGTPRLFPPRPQHAPPVRSQEVFRQDPGPVGRVGGGGFSGAEFAPCPSPRLLPPVGMGWLFSGVSQSLCFANRRRCVPARQPEVLASSPRVWCAPSPHGEQPRQPEARAASPRVLRSQRFGALSTGARRLFPPRPQRAPPVRSQEEYKQNPYCKICDIPNSPSMCN